jgi:hypothetical protein
MTPQWNQLEEHVYNTKEETSEYSSYNIGQLPKGKVHLEPKGIHITTSIEFVYFDPDSPKEIHIALVVLYR